MGCFYSKKIINKLEYEILEKDEEILEKENEILNLKYEIKIYKNQIKNTKFFFQQILKKNNIKL